MDLTRTTQTWEVESQTEAALVYLVRFHRDCHWSCSCPDYLYRRARLRDACKHIHGMHIILYCPRCDGEVIAVGGRALNAEAWQRKRGE
jgi:hypothetical protein